FFRVLRFTQTLERALALALGVSLEVSATDAVIIPGEKLQIRATFNNGSSQPLPVAFHAPEQLSFAGAKVTLATTDPTQVIAGGALTHEFTYDSKDAPLSLPREAHLFDEEYYPLGTTLPGAQPAEPFGHRVVVTAEVALGQVTVVLAALARFDVAPTVEVATAPFALIKDWETPRDIELPVRLRNR